MDFWTCIRESLNIIVYEKLKLGSLKDGNNLLEIFLYSFLNAAEVKVINWKIIFIELGSGIIVSENDMKYCTWHKVSYSCKCIYL